MKKIVIICFAAAIAVSSCKTWSNSEKGAAIGAGTGAAAGAAIGNAKGNTLMGALIGAAVGGTAGALIGNYMDRQVKELQNDLKNAKVERVGEGIKITFDSGILFDIDSYNLRAESKNNLSDLAKVLQKYDDTNILIEGHTDNTGTTEHNQALSDKRADAVSDYLKTLGVSGSRIAARGYGEGQPVASNADDTGRQQNRRVDVGIMANKKLKRAAEKGEIGSLE